MRRNRPTPIAPTARTTASTKRRRSEAGDTFIEVLLALVVLGTASVALLIAFSTSIAASSEHRSLARSDTVLATASQEIIAAIQNDASLFQSACSNPIANYPYYNVPITLPSPYTSDDVEYVNTSATSVTTATPNIQYWNGTSYGTQCEDNQPQLITIGLAGTTYTNSFVVVYPVGASTGGAGSATASQLIFLQQPVGGYAGSPFTTQPIVEISNGSGAVTTDLSPVTLTLTTGTGILSDCQGNEILGVVTFSNCTIGTGGTGFQITATDGNLTPAVSDPFDVSSSTYALYFKSSAPSGPNFNGEPVGAASGSPFATEPSVEILNAQGSLDTSWAGSVTFTSSGGWITNCTGALSSTITTVTYSVLNGKATAVGCDFSGGYFYNANSSPQVTATQYTMTATATPTTASDAALPTLSSSFSVSSFGPATQLAFTTEPTGVANNIPTTPFTRQPTVAVEDAFGNVVTSATVAADPITLSISGGQTLTCSTPSLSEGTYTYTNCHGSADGNLLFLTASSAAGLTSATSTTFNITNAATQLVFTTSPTAGTSGAQFSVQPVLQYEDASGNVVTAATSAITFSVSPVGGALSNCTGLVPSSGVMKVSNCVFTGLVGTPYTLTASGGGLTSLPSAPFSPTGPGAASQLVFATQPVAGASGSPFTTQPVIDVEDVAGNLVTSSSASISAFTLSPNDNGLSLCSGLTATAGVINVSNCTFGGVVGTNYTITPVSGTLTAVASSPFSPTGPGPTAQIYLGGCPANVTVSATCTLSAVLEDAYNNVETPDNASAVTFFEATGGGTFSGLTTTFVTGGIANDAVTAATPGPVTFYASADGVTSGPWSVTVNALPSITTTSLSSATQGETGYSQTLAETGGTTPFSWTISSGTLPAGLSLNASTGSITGTVSGSAVTSTFTVTLTDADGLSTTAVLGITVYTPPVITTTSLATATQNETGYSQTLAGTGGATPYTWSETGTMPTGLTLNSSGLIAGTVSSSATTKTFTVKLIDANGASVTKSLTITVNAAPTITPSSLPGATKGGTYHQTLGVTGGTAPFGSWSITAGIVPAGLSFDTVTGAITGTVSNAAVSEFFSVQITDANNVTASKTYSIVVSAPPSITTTTLATATQTETGYSQTLAATGGTTPYTWSILTGILPSGLTLNSSTGAITGTVGASAVNETFTAEVTDSDGVGTTASLTISVNASPSITTTTLADATQGQTGYSQTLAATGGTTPLTWSETGTLPSGLSLSSTTGIISGNVSASATVKSYAITVRATDANGVSGTQALSITVNATPTIAPTTLPAATLGGNYSQTLSVSGGTMPYGSWSLKTGTLPTGLSLNTVTGVISGSNVAGTTQTFTVQITDANNVTASRAYTLTVNGAPSVTTTTLPAATQTETVYSQTLAVSGGTSPYTWSETGTMPTGLTLSSAGVISGTVGSGAVSETFTVKVTDTNGVAATKSLTLTVNAAPSVTTTSLAGATQGQTGYSQTLAETGGTTPYTWSETGTMPTGLTLSSAGVISGNVSPAALSENFTVKVTDTNGVAATKSLTIIVNAAPTITTTTLASATDTETGYSQTLGVTSGTTPYGNWSITVGALPTGLTLAPSTGVISGTLGASATSTTFTVSISDANGVAATKTLGITVSAAPSITTTSLSNATTTGAYSQTLAVSGGTTPLTWSISGGTLPVGITLNTSTGVLSATDVTGTTQSFTVKVVDTHGISATKVLSITVNGVPSVTTTTLATATQGQTGYSQTLAASGGTTPYTWTETGTMPAGLSLSTAGVISGTLGGSAVTETFTVKVTDANGVAATKSLTITVNAAPNITTTTLANATQGQAGYSQTLAATGGTTPLTWTEIGTLPTGLTLSSAGVLSGTVSATATVKSYAITLKVTDANSVTATQAVTVTVYAAPNISSATPQAATLTGAYSQTIGVTGGAPNLTWSLITGSLPAGITLNSVTGVLSATDVTGTTQTFTLKVTDANGFSDTQALTLTVNAAPTITMTTLTGDFSYHTNSSVPLTASGGTGTMTWSLISGGTLPNGLRLSAAGVLSGRPTAHGTFNFTIEVTDANGVSDTQAYSVTI